MEETIGDFWRMISEQSISTIVMISEVREQMESSREYLRIHITFSDW